MAQGEEEEREDDDEDGEGMRRWSVVRRKRRMICRMIDTYAVQRLMCWNGHGVLECKALELHMRVRQTKATVSHETLQWMIMGEFTATTAPLLPPASPAACCSKVAI